MSFIVKLHKVPICGIITSDIRLERANRALVQVLPHVAVVAVMELVGMRQVVRPRLGVVAQLESKISFNKIRVKYALSFNRIDSSLVGGYN